MDRRAGLFAVTLLVSCVGHPRGPDADPPCEIGPRTARPAAPPVAGYPIQRVVLGDAQLAARKAELERLAPGWTITLARNGEPATMTTVDVVGPFEETLSAPRCAQVGAMLIAVGLVGPNASVRPRGNAGNGDVVGDVVGHGDLDIGQARTQSSYTSPVRLEVGHRETVPGLPPGTTELSDDDLRDAAWGPGWSSRRARVVEWIGHPCNVELGCGETSRSCVRLGELRLERRVVEVADGIRHIAVLHGMPAPTTKIETAVPTCVDAVTAGECTFDLTAAKVLGQAGR